MKKTICLTISLLYSILLCANNLNGEYINDSGCKILISGSTMYYIERQDHNPLWYNDTGPEEIRTIKYIQCLRSSAG